MTTTARGCDPGIDATSDGGTVRGGPQNLATVLGLGGVLMFVIGRPLSERRLWVR